MRRFIKSIIYLLMFLIVFLVTQLFVGVVIGLLGFNAYSDELFMLNYLLSMGFAFVAVTIFERVAFKSITPIEAKWSGFDPVAVLAGVVLLIALSVVLAPLSTILPADDRVFHNGPCTLITIVVLAPIFEELIFRGRLYNTLQRNASPLLSASLSALAFGVVHLNPIVMIEALLVGVIFSYFYLLKRSIITPILLHMCNNAIAYALLVLSYQGVPLRQIIGSLNLTIVLYVVSAIIFIASAVIIVRYFVKQGREGGDKVVADQTPAVEPCEETPEQVNTPHEEA
ncbi:MAG: CPBP family intramembrane metalloprotease [Alistipes sp.]|nr:CPBP family intramembrane metalloprotease [Alistipes sp.]